MAAPRNFDFFHRVGGYPDTRQSLASLILSYIDASNTRPRLDKNTVLSPLECRPEPEMAISSSTRHPSPHHRPVPPLVRHPMFKREQCNFALTRRLHGGSYKWSQVWLATMYLRGLPQLGSATVVVKLYQESRYEWAQGELEEGYNPVFAAIEYTDRLAKNEAWAYDCLRELQGRVIPWSYGSFKFRLPNGEISFAQVMEYVDGPLVSTFSSIASPPYAGLETMLDHAAQSLWEIHRCGVAHGDTAMLQNMILHPHSQTIVFINFAYARSAVHGENAVRARGNDFLAILGVLHEFLPARDRDLLHAQMLWAERRKREDVPWKQLLFDADAADPYYYIFSFSEID
ncbi:hypothetical protein B0H21DRAFT_544065 [Amylocystis lapponica]|nr:hypothetical protein B0H21DRAFT_544065 [Amylocystis lapponica]